MSYDQPGAQLEAWQQGRTGFPVVDAGMRQLRATGWMHNRVRMIVASFLVKDLHVEWQHGARHFMRWLVDGDLPPTSTAGSGRRAPAPTRRRSSGSSTRPARAGSSTPTAATCGGGSRSSATRTGCRTRTSPTPTPATWSATRPPIVDHQAERQEALDRWQAMR